jgi:hypothetical protein
MLCLIQSADLVKEEEKAARKEMGLFGTIEG